MNCLLKAEGISKLRIWGRDQTRSHSDFADVFLRMQGRKERIIPTVCCFLIESHIPEKKLQTISFPTAFWQVEEEQENTGNSGKKTKH